MTINSQAEDTKLGRGRRGGSYKSAAVEKLIRDGHLKKLGPTEILATIELAGARASLGTIGSRLRVLRQADATGPWSLAESDYDERTNRRILDVLYVVSYESEGRRAHLTTGEARHVARITGAAPGLDAWPAYRLAHEYLLCKSKAEGTEHLDAFLAYAPWVSASRQADYEHAVQAGWVAPLPVFMTLENDMRIAIDWLTDLDDERLAGAAESLRWILSQPDAEERLRRAGESE